MCGIVGYISTESGLYEKEKEHFMHFALQLDTLRGDDSTGVMTVGDSFQPHVVKSLTPGDKFVHSPRWESKRRTGWAQIGHNRAATVGNVTIENAHPFKFGPITLVHNGTLRDHGRSLQHYLKDLDVDSMQIARSLMLEDPEQAQDVIERIDGAYTLVWLDERDKSVNIVRNEERPLHFTYSPDRKIFWFMSDGAHLQCINESLGRSPARGTTIFKLDAHKLMKFRFGSIVPEVTEIVPFVWTPTGQTTTKSGGTNKSVRTGLESAADEWQKNLAKHKREKELRERCARTTIAGKSRTVPVAMLQALEKEFGLNPTEMMSFKPKAGIRTEGGMYVTGEVTIEAWGDCPWDAVMYNCTEVQYNAYKRDTWLVRPIGIGHPVGQNDDGVQSPSLLVHLVHCDYASYEDRHPKAPTSDYEECVIPTVIGPHGREVSWDSLKPKLENGCVSCGCNLAVGQLHTTHFVNNDQDILCGDCHEDLIKGIVGAERCVI